MQVKIGFKKYDIRMEDRIYTDEPVELYGQCDFRKNSIRVAQSLGKMQAACTLLHEVLHGIDHDRGTDLTEQQIVQVANGLYQFFVDNRDFLQSEEFKKNFSEEE